MGTSVVATFASPDPFGNLSANINWTGGTATPNPSAGAIVPIGSVFVPGVGNVPQYRVQSTVTYGASTGLLQTGYFVNIFDTFDGTSAVAPGTLQITRNPLAFVTGFASPTTTEGTSVTFNVARFSQVTFAANPNDYAGTIDFGDGSPVGALSFVSNGGGQYTASATHTYARPGSYAYSYSIRDTQYGGSSLNGTSASPFNAGNVVVNQATLSNAYGPIPTNGIVGGQLTDILIGGFSYGNPLARSGDFSASIAWGDGSTSGGSITNFAPGVFAVQGTHTYLAPGNYTAVTTIRNLNGNQTLAENTPIAITNSPIAVNAQPVVVTEGTGIPAGTPFGSFVDESGSLPGVVYAATATVKGTVVPLTVTPGASHTFSLAAAANTAIPGGLEEGVYAYTLNVTNNQGASATSSGAVFVNDAPLLLTGFSALATVEGSPLVNVGLISFSDGNPLSLPGEFTATIDWGDGSPMSLGVVTGGNGAFLVSGSHTYAEVGSYSIRVSVTGEGTQTVTGTAGAVVVDAALSGGVPLPVRANENQPLQNVPVATFVDANPFSTAADFTGTIFWGDTNPAVPDNNVAFQLIGGTSAGNIYAVYGSHVYNRPGSFPITVRVNDKDGASLVINPVGLQPPAPPAVNNAVIAQSPILVTVFPIASLSTGQAIPSTQVIATFQDVGGPEDNINDYTATINWGDGSPLTTGLGLTISHLGGGLYQITTNPPLHAYAQPGIYTITVTVVDNEVPASNSATGIGANVAIVVPGTITITPLPAPAPAPVEGQELYLVPVATFTDSNPLAVPAEFTARIDWGDGSPVSLVAGVASPPAIGMIVPDTLANIADPTRSHFIVLGTHTYMEETPPNRPVPITVLITDNFGGISTSYSVSASAQTIALPVLDAPLVSGAGVPVFGTENQPLNSVPVATFVDTNPFATASDFTGSILWGDGSGPDTNARFALVGGNAQGAIFAVYGSHVYTQALGSPYTIAVTVRDVGGSSIAVVPITTTATIGQGALVVSGVPLTTSVGVPVPAGKVVATFLDLGGPDALADYSAIIDWGDGTSTAAVTITPLGGGSFSVAAVNPKTYVKAGNYAIRVTVDDADPASGIGGSLIVVSSATLVASPPPGGPITGAVEGAPLTATVAQFTTNNPGALLGDFTATIDWGDGSPQTVGAIIPGGAPGTFLVTGRHTYTEEGGPFFVSTFITDASGAKANTTAIVNIVADAPLSNGRGVPVNGAEHQPLNDVPVATFVDANPYSTESDFVASILWGDGTPVDINARVRLVGGSAAGNIFAVYGSHTFEKAGSYVIGVNVQDVGGSSIAVTPITPTATITQSPLSVNVLPLTPILNVAFPAARQVVATFTDAGGPDPLSAYSATIDWGDGSAPYNTVPGDIVALGGGAFSISVPAGAHTYTKPGAFALKVTVVDDDPASGIGGNFAIVARPALTATPLPANGPIQAVEGLPLVNVGVAQFTSSDPAAVAADFTAVIDWGDGSPLSFGTISRPGGPGTPFVVTGNHTYLEEDTAGYNVTVVISDRFGDRVTALTSADVHDATLVNPVGIPQFVGSGQALINAPLGTFADNNPFGTVSDFTATINWGDGSPTTLGFVTAVGGNATQAFFSVSGSHLYATAGVKNVSISVVDAGGQSTTINTTVTVTASQLSLSAFPISATEGLPTPAALLVGSFTDLGYSPGTTYQVTVNWGDGTTNNNLTGVIVAPTAPGSNTFNIFAPSHTYVEEGTYILTLTVVGSNGSGPITAVNLATVKDAALTGINGGIINGVEGNPIGFQTIVTFTDANPLAPVSDFTATIDWGDGSIGFGTIAQPGGPGTVFLVQGNHTYKSEGVFSIIVQIVDEGGSRTTATATAVIAEAPITVNPTPLVLNGYKNVALVNVDLATFTSANPFERAVDFVASINWGDGTSTAGVIIEDALHVFHVNGSHVYTQAGTFFPVITIAETDSPTLLGQTTAQVNIQAVPLLVTGVNVLATEGIYLPNAQNTTNGTVVATFINTVGFDPISAYTAQIDWGNGLITPGTILPLGGPNFEVVAPANPLIRYAEAGTYTIKVTVTDTNAITPAGFFSAFGFSTAHVLDAPLTADPIQPIVNGFQQTPLLGTMVAKFTDGNPIAPLSDFVATIDWGDGTPQSAGTFVQPGGVGTAFYVLGNHTYANPTTPPNLPYRITVYIRDEDGARLTTTTQANIQASTITGTPVRIDGVEGKPLPSVIVAYFNDSGIPGPLSSYSARIDWGTGLPGSVTIGQIVPLGGNDFAVMGSYTYPEENVAPNLPYSVTVTINHNGLLATTVVSQANIADAPIMGMAAPFFTTEGAEFKGTVAFFTDMNPNGVASDFTALINWGDGTQSTGTVLPSGGGFIVQATDPVSGVGKTYKNPGSFSYWVRVTDEGGATFTSYSTATVFDAPLTATGVTATAPEYQVTNSIVTGLPIVTSFNGVIASFNDAAFTPTNPLTLPLPPGFLAANYFASINWGDGTVTPGSLRLNAQGSAFEVIASHLYDEGTYHVTVTINDLDGTSTVNAVSTLTITDNPLNPLPVQTQVPLNQTEGLPFTVQVVTFTDSNALAPADDFSATINWGDGSPVSVGTVLPMGVITQPDGVTKVALFGVYGTHVYTRDTTAPGATPYNISVLVKDVGGQQVTVANTANVGDAPMESFGTSIQAIEGVTFTNTLIATWVQANPYATVADFTTNGGKVTVDWGDGSAIETLTAASISALGGPNGVTFRALASHKYVEEGSYQVTVNVLSNGGSVTVAHSEADVADGKLTPAAVQPVVSTTEAVNFPVPVFGQPVNLGPVAAFVDQNADAPVSDFTATIDWGDGTPRQTGIVTKVNSSGLFYVNGSHTYADAGMAGQYTITVYVVDEGGSSVTLTNTAVVADVPINLMGTLDPKTDSGPSNTDAVTNVPQPKFYGMSEPFSTVYVYATPEGSSDAILIGKTQANNSGAWKITSSLLADGVYTITSTAVDQFGKTQANITILPNANQGPLVIDTHGPKVNNVVFDPHHGQVFITFQDNLSGTYRPTIVNAKNYNLTGLTTFVATGSYQVTRILTGPQASPNNFIVGPVTDPTAPITAAVQFNRGHVLRNGHYLFTAFSGKLGITDLAGNQLDGEFYKHFQSGNNVNGGNFVARLDAVHGVGLAPKSVIGPASPLGPNGGPNINPTPVNGVRTNTAVKNKVVLGAKAKVTTKLATTTTAKKATVTSKVATPKPLAVNLHQAPVKKATTTKH